jgi:hypothetical protein
MLVHRSNITTSSIYIYREYSDTILELEFASHIYQACNMERSAQKYFAIASLLGMHLMRTQSRIQKALHLCYSFFIFLLVAPVYFYIIISEYSYLSQFGENGGSEGLITVYFFIIIYNVTLSIQHFVSFYWLLTKSQDFFKLIEQIDFFARTLSCKEQLEKNVMRLDSIFTFIVTPALCALTLIECSTYDASDYQLLQVFEDCYGSTVVAIWQWKIILVASSMKIIISKLNANLKVPKFNIFI